MRAEQTPLKVPLWNHRCLIIAITLVAVLASILASLFLPPSYRVEALVELDKTDTQSLKPNEGKELLESRVLLTQALEQLSLDVDPLTFKSPWGNSKGYRLHQVFSGRQGPRTGKARSREDGGPFPRGAE